ncbi:MAG: nuclear transport factor 2 family protein [Planctomycetia bacterium]|nr:nuclear transport factor 2 family protein [Planctomycetia bacterium]
MHTSKWILSAALLLTLSLPCWAARPIESAADEQDVKEANHQFYSSLNAMFTGDATPMSQVWSHADDVTYMGPTGGILVGWEQIGEVWESQAALKLGGEVLPEETHVILGSELSIVQCREVGHNLDAQGKPLQVSIRATNIFRKEAGEWKMIGHHTDVLPFLNQEPSAASTK